MVGGDFGGGGGSGGGLGGGGDGLGGGGGGRVSQTYLRLASQGKSFHLPSAALGLPFICRQSSLPFQLSGCPEFQLVYDSGVPEGLHTHVPSEAASVPPIHAALPAAAVSSSAFSAAECTLARCWPAARQAALASLHDRASFISVYNGGGGESGGGGKGGDGGGEGGDGGEGGAGGGDGGGGEGGGGDGGGGLGEGGGGKGGGGGCIGGRSCTTKELVPWQASRSYEYEYEYELV